MDQTTSASSLTVPQRRRAVAAASLGNALEFYDFVTYAYFAIQIGRTFFPSVSPFVSLMGSLAAFGAGFITRPIGAHVIGGYADRKGRKPAMLFSMTLMGAGILLLALTPGYATIGYAAPVIAVIARLMQGFALGGEVGSASAYLMESAHPLRRGWAISWQGGSQYIAASVGALVGLILSLVLSSAQLDAFGWRIALLLGASIVPAALVIRNSLPETLSQSETTEAGSAPVEISAYLRPIICGFFAIASGTIATYIFHYMATFGQQQLKLSAAVSMAGELANDAAGLIAVMAGGLLSDRIGRRPVSIWAQLTFAVLIVPNFLWLTRAPGTVSFIGANIILSVFSAFWSGANYAAISESLPPHLRARVFALVYSLPVAIFGGTTQLVITWMLHVTGNPMSVAWYLTAVSLIGVFAVAGFRESAPAVVGHTTRWAEPALA
jgi:MHS family citrate/tricarballylate:H+ symporter-like MFS transporter